MVKAAPEGKRRKWEGVGVNCYVWAFNVEKPRDFAIFPTCHGKRSKIGKRTKKKRKQTIGRREVARVTGNKNKDTCVDHTVGDLKT